MGKLFYSLAALSFAIMLTVSCNEDQLDNEVKTIDIKTVDLQKAAILKEKFAISLAKALDDNQGLRQFIKEEALKKINKDFDVIYQVVKNQTLTSSYSRSSSSQSIRDILLPYFLNEAELLEIENALPLLTIFVPDLQDGSFSAVNWNTTNQIPLVAVRSHLTNDVKIINSLGEQNMLPAEFMPDFPVVVVKDNERIISSMNLTQFNSLDTQIITNSNSSVQLRFLDDNFDGTGGVYTPQPILTPGLTLSRISQFEINSYNAFANFAQGGWQRDFIYYGLTPTNTVGFKNPNYREHVTYFKLLGPPTSAYQGIATSQDPNLMPTVFGTNPNVTAAWTDGSFEFKVFNQYGAKASNVDASEVKGFYAEPNDLFEISYVPASTNFLVGLVLKRPVITATKSIDFFNGGYKGQRLEFVSWSLHDFSYMWKIVFEEVDVPTTQEFNKTESNKYNANIGIDISTGDKVKYGLKFGASAEQNLSFSYKETKTDVSDFLGQTVINFEDNVININPSTNTFEPRKFSTGKVEFEFRPVRVQ